MTREKIVSKTVCCINALDSFRISQPKYLYGKDNCHMLPLGVPWVTLNEHIVLPNIWSGSYAIFLELLEMLAYFYNVAVGWKTNRHFMYIKITRCHIATTLPYV